MVCCRWVVCNLILCLLISFQIHPFHHTFAFLSRHLQGEFLLGLIHFPALITSLQEMPSKWRRWSTTDISTILNRKSSPLSNRFDYHHFIPSTQALPHQNPPPFPSLTFYLLRYVPICIISEPPRLMVLALGICHNWFLYYTSFNLIPFQQLVKNKDIDRFWEKFCEQKGCLLAIGGKCTKQSQCDWHSKKGLGGMANQEAGGEDLQLSVPQASRPGCL